MSIRSRLRGPSPRIARRLAGAVAVIPLLLQSCDPGCTPTTRDIAEQQIGSSIKGRPIMAYRIGDPNGAKVMVIGQIHGDEHAGIEIADHIRDTAPIPAGFDVWVIPTINPDGDAAGTHVNAGGVDLNRNFGPDWQSNDCAAEPIHCAGSGPLSEQESKVIAAFVTQIRPIMTVWYHGPLYTVDKAVLHGVANQNVLYAYARAATYSVTTVNCSPTGYCVGNATQYMNDSIPDTSAFVVELSTNARNGVSDQALVRHANAFYAAAAAAVG